MADLQKALTFFHDNTPDSPELKKVKSLYEVGKSKMIEYYDSLLRRHSHPDQAKTVLIAIKAKTTLDLDFPQSTLGELNKISGSRCINKITYKLISKILPSVIFMSITT
jgi:hypothetical protein